ncbi:cytochrome c oxidase subunit 3 [Mycoplana rhizolycopersici]|uniref:Cytochrome c oxidase subunit 3 n=1 Tax=Mycoplana rhizolycopersici TaxID=2746702 RepID=A0ABX2Q7X4_9HYPH|nr:cytochrome c oxidase subunit 3 [Rhizobium rhizolycopersici]NVP53817.1 cytochrome c oxidase subunit 3 [Rhizobium rhizolycopersici]
MSAMILFLVVIAAIIAWWLAGQGLMAKPWLEVGSIGAASAGDHHAGSPRLPAQKIGLGVFLAVVGALFTLFVSAYLMRVSTQDWWTTPVPRLLYVNTGILFASSLCLQRAATQAARGRLEGLRTALLAGLATALAFVTGQVFAWRQLVAAGYTLSDDAAASFFYVISGLHGLHILGGMVALARAVRFAGREQAVSPRLRLGVELCAVYWHFMLAVWLVLLALFAGWAGSVVEFCRQLIT